MRLGFHSIHKAALLVAFALSIGPPGSTAWAVQSNVTYNFNNDNGVENGWFTSVDGTAPLWNWQQGSSNVGGGWQALSGTNDAGSASYLTSPCFVLSTNTSQQYVNLVMLHRFGFPLLSGSVNELGQIQYRLDTGSGWGAWTGIPNSYFVKPNGAPAPQNVLPSFGPPFPPLITSAGTAAVLAWSGTTVDFTTGDHQPSELTLQFADFGLQNGDEIQFRFGMATNVAVSGTNTVVWEINKIQIDGVAECPEPGALVLAGVGLAALVAVRRRRPCRRPRPGSGGPRRA